MAVKKGRRRVLREAVSHYGGKVEYDLVVEGDDTQKGKVIARQRIRDHMPHDRMFRRDELSAVQHQAAEAFLKDFTLACMEPLRAHKMHYEERGHAEISDIREDAKRRVRQCLRALEPLGASIVYRICGEGLNAKETGLIYAIPARFVTVRLREALDTVAKVRGISA